MGLKLGLAASAAIIVTAGAAHADTYIRLAADTGKCIHKESSDFDNGNPLHLWTCNGNTTNSLFTYDADTGYIHFAEDTSKCIHKKNGNFSNGNPLHLWDCSVGTEANKSFIYDTRSGAIHFREDTSKCVHLQNSNTNNGNPLHLWTCNGNDNMLWEMDIATGDDSVAVDTPVLLKSSDAAYAVQSDGDSAGAVERLGSCADDTEDPTCLWVFEPSPTRAGAYYIKRSDTDLYLHSQGGSNTGASHTLHACDITSDYPNCQWFLEASSTRDGAHYIKSAEEALYLHSHGGSNLNASQTLHACPEANDYGNCQFYINEPADEFGSAAGTGTTLSTLQSSVWTSWISRDGPSGSADAEHIAGMLEDGLLSCDDPTDIQARRKSDGLLAEFTGEIFDSYDTTTGFICFNADQADGSCDDYEVRYACPLWSSWVSRDSTSGTGDYEGIASHFEAGDFACDTAMSFEARRISDGVDAAATGETVTYNTDYGFACLHDDQADGACDDYEVRMRCAVDEDAIETYGLTGVAANFEAVGLGGAAMSGVWFAELDQGTIGQADAARMDQSGRLMVETADGTSASASDATIVALVGDLQAQGILGETGTATVNDGGITIELSGRYSKPVVFAQVVSRNETDPVIATTVYNTIGSGANDTLTIDLVEPDTYDGSHGDEIVHYAVITAGTYGLDNGSLFHVGRIATPLKERGLTEVSIPPMPYVMESTESVYLVTRLQGADGWNSMRSEALLSDNLLSKLSIYAQQDRGVAFDTLGYMIVAGGVDQVAYDDTVAAECGSGGDGQDFLLVDEGTYGNNTISASHYFQAGITQAEGYMWAGAKAGVNAKLFGDEEEILGLEASASEDNGEFDSRVYLNAFPAGVLIDEPIGLTFDWSTSQTFFAAQATYFGVTVSGELVGTLGMEASLALAGNGMTIGGMPYADVTASAAASIGGWCLSAGIGADLSILAVSVPTEATIAVSGNDVAWSVESNVEMETLAGSIYLFVDYCVSSEEYEIFSWDGIDLPTIELIDEAGCF